MEVAGGWLEGLEKVPGCKGFGFFQLDSNVIGLFDLIANVVGI